MTVQNANRKDVYLTNGTTIYWPYTFEVIEKDGSDLALYETNLTTGETKLIDTNLTRDIINSRIKYPRTGSPRPAGYKITVARITERTQGIDLETQSFDPKNMERGLDKLTAMVQEIDETVSRAAVADISQQGVNFTFPSPVGGKVVGWNAEGTGLINLDNTTLGIEAQMLAATEAAQTASGKVDNLVSTAFESDGTTVKKATHSASATLAEAAKFDTRFSITGCIGGSADRQVFSEDSFEAQQIRRNIPSGKKLVIKRASYDLVPAASETELYLFVECSGGTGDWLSTTDAGDNSLDVTLCSNTTGSTFEVTIRIWIISGYPGGIKPQSGWSVEFAIEDV